MAAVRDAVATLALTALALSGCSAPHKDTPRAASDLGQASPYEAAVLADGATALWPLRDADGLRTRDQVAELGPSHRTGTVVGGEITGTSSPAAARAALFLRSGRIVTPMTSGLTDAAPFSLELGLRTDACTTAWGRVVGTSALTDKGREGLEVLHFPSQFSQNPCRLAVEFWHLGRYVGGCHPADLPAVGRWVHLAVVYADRVVTCYEDGRVVDRQPLRSPAVFTQPAPFGIGGSGSGFQGPLDGVSLSEVAVYDQPLTLTQVRAHAGLLRRQPKT